MGVILSISLVSSQFLSVVEINAANWYSQKGIVYEGKALNSMCYITSYAMILKNLSFDATPVDVYLANGKSNYVNHAKLEEHYQIITQSGSFLGLKAEDKEKLIISLLKKHPEGVIVKGVYDTSKTHFIVASKVEDGQVYFDDPAFEKEEDGCCILMKDTWKLTWDNLTEYRVLNKENTSSVSSDEMNSNTNNTSSSAITSEKEKNKENTDTKEKNSRYPIPKRTLYVTTPYMKGNDIKWLQESLNILGYTCKINGIYNVTTKKNLMKFQGDNGLSKDGYVGKLTREKILELLEFVATGSTKWKPSKVNGVTLKKKIVKKKSKVYAVTYGWKKVKNVTGYQIIYSANNTFKSKKIKRTLKNINTISKLKKGKTYYIKIRAYKKVNNKFIYGTYSNVKKIRVKG